MQSITYSKVPVYLDSCPKKLQNFDAPLGFLRLVINYSEAIDVHHVHQAGKENGAHTTPFPRIILLNV